MIVNAFLNSLSSVTDIFFSLVFFLFISGTFCSTLWKGAFDYRCQDDVTGEWVDEEELCYPQTAKVDDHVCNSLVFFDDSYSCEQGLTCADFKASPEEGYLNFDNVAFGMLTLFATCTLDGWSRALFDSQNVSVICNSNTAEYFSCSLLRSRFLSRANAQVMGQGTFLIFVAVILIGHVTLMNIMISSILAHFDLLKDLTFEMNVERNLIAWKKERDRQRVQNKYMQKRLRALEYGDPPPWPPLMVALELCSQALAARCAPFTRVIDQVFMYHGFPRGKEPGHWSSKARWFIADDTSPFNYFIQALILGNTVALAMDAHGINDKDEANLVFANTVFTAVFLVEMVTKLLVQGIPEYVGNLSNRFDAFVVVGSFAEICLSSGNSSLGVLRVVRILRFARVARLAKLVGKWESLRSVVYRIAANLPKMAPIIMIQVSYCDQPALWWHHPSVMKPTV
jgi:hypothetical protein